MKKPTSNPLRSKPLRICAGSLAVTAVALSSAQAQNIAFDGGTSNPGVWEDPVNWTGDVLPGAGNPLTDIGVDPALTPGGALVATASLTSSQTISELRIGRGDGAVGVLNHSAGTLNTGGWSFIGVDASGAPASGTYNLSGSGNLQVAGNIFVGFGGGAGNSTGVFEVSDNAILDLNGSLGAQQGAFVVGANDGNNGTLNQTGGSITYNAWMTVGESSGATGTYNMSGGSLNQNSDWLTVGENSFANGTVNVSGTADINLNANGLTLGRRTDGTGTFSVNGSTATIDTTQLLIGIDTDSFTASGTGNLNFTADATGVSPIIASSDVWINDGTGTGSSSLTVDMSLAPAGDILLVGVGGNLNGTFAGLPEGSAVPGSGGRFITYTFGDGNDIGLIVPEPTTMGLLGLGALALLTVRRKRS